MHVCDNYSIHDYRYFLWFLFVDYRYFLLELNMAYVSFINCIKEETKTFVIFTIIV